MVHPARLLALLCFWTARAVAVAVIAVAAPAAVRAQQISSPVWTVPEIGALPDDAHGRLVRRGRDLITATYAHIGPEVPDPAKRYAGNNLACSNCHLEAGTKKFGLPIFGLFELFPQYSARLGAEITIEDRVNSCMTRSMNGRALPLESPEMQALVGYIRFLSSGVPAGKALSGLGAGSMPELDRAADPVRGKAVYAKACLSCHNEDGSGIRRSLPSVDLGYMVPPLWGPDSFNDGAGMARILDTDPGDAVAQFAGHRQQHFGGLHAVVKCEGLAAQQPAIFVARNKCGTSRTVCIQPHDTHENAVGRALGRGDHERLFGGGGMHIAQ